MPRPFDTLLVATDFSEASQPATAYAFRLARALQARLYLLHVIPEIDLQLMRAISERLQSTITPTAFTDLFYTEADKRLAQVVADAQAADLVIERLIVTGQPAAAIISWATAKQVQLILLGTHGRGRLDRFLLGSVAEEVLRRAPCSVLVVPAPRQ